MIISCKPRFGVQNKLRPSVPLPSFGRRQPELARRRRMTIGIGALCGGGAVIAADTRVIGSDGLTHDERKVRIERSHSGVFVTTYSALDVNAAKSLLNDVYEELLQSDLSTLRDVEGIVRPVMARWSASHPHGAPAVDFILGAALSTPWTPDRTTCGGLGLYHCEPPATMTRKHFREPVPATYVAIGDGSSIVDPLRKSLFRTMTNPVVCLKQIGYLMYRAKKDFASTCGGATTAVFLRENSPADFEIVPICMDQAERLGPQLDMMLGTASDALLASTNERATEFCDMFRARVGLLRGYRQLNFITQFGQELCEDGSIRQLNSQTSTDQQ